MKLTVRVRPSAETAVSPLTPGVFRPAGGIGPYPGRTTNALRAMATSLTGQPSPATVNCQAGTLARPRLVRTVTRRHEAGAGSGGQPRPQSRVGHVRGWCAFARADVMKDATWRTNSSKS